MKKQNEYSHVFGMRESVHEKDAPEVETKYTQCTRVYTIIYLCVVFVLSVACAALPFYTFVSFRFAYPVLAAGNVTFMGPAAWLLMLSGLVAIIMCGILALFFYFNYPRAVLTMYALFCVPACALIIGGSLALWARNQYGWRPYEYDEKAEEVLRNQYQQPGNYDWSYAMDSTQQYFQCCAFRDNSWTVYQQTKWYAHQPGVVYYNKPCVPVSCCKRDQFGNIYNSNQCQINWAGVPCTQSSNKNEAVFYNGCSRYMYWIVDKFGLSFGIISIFNGVIMIVSFVLMLLAKLSSSDE